MSELNQDCEAGGKREECEEAVFTRQCLPGMFPGNQERALVDTHTNFARATDSIAID